MREGRFWGRGKESKTRGEKCWDLWNLAHKVIAHKPNYPRLGSIIRRTLKRQGIVSVMFAFLNHLFGYYYRAMVSMLPGAFAARVSGHAAQGHAGEQPAHTGGGLDETPFFAAIWVFLLIEILFSVFVSCTVCIWKGIWLWCFWILFPIYHTYMYMQIVPS